MKNLNWHNMIEVKDYDPDLICKTGLYTVYHMTPKMIALLTPVSFFRRIGYAHPTLLYSRKEVEDFLESEEGKRLMEAANKRRENFWNGIKRKLYPEEQELKKEQDA